jgi:hypothetical protein
MPNAMTGLEAAGEPAEPFGFGGLVAFDFHADDPPVGGFQDDVNLCTGAVLPVEHGDVGGRPGELSAEFGEDEGLDELTRRRVAAAIASGNQPKITKDRG